MVISVSDALSSLTFLRHFLIKQIGGNAYPTQSVQVSCSLSASSSGLQLTNFSSYVLRRVAKISTLHMLRACIFSCWEKLLFCCGLNCPGSLSAMQFSALGGVLPIVTHSSPGSIAKDGSPSCSVLQSEFLPSNLCRIQECCCPRCEHFMCLWQMQSGSEEFQKAYVVFPLCLTRGHQFSHHCRLLPILASVSMTTSGSCG